MNQRTKIELIAGAVVVALLIVAAWYYHDAELRRVHAQAVSDAKDEVIHKNADEIKQRDAAMAQREVAFQQQQQQFLAQMAAIKTMQQATAVIGKAVQSPVAEVKAQDLPADVRKHLPDSPSYSVMTQEQSIVLAKRELQCEATESALTHERQDSADLRADKQLLANSLQAESEKTKEWKRAAQGGSWIKRAAKDGLKVGGTLAASYLIWGRKK